MLNQNFFDSIQWIDFVLQLAIWEWTAQGVTNDQLLEELQKQNKNYLETIIEQNNEILKKLAELG